MPLPPPLLPLMQASLPKHQRLRHPPLRPPCSASSLVLSLDRTIGGRLFGGVVFIGTVFTGASVGGAFVSLAWLARGDSEALLQYFGVTSLPDAATMQRGQDALAALAAVPLPPPLREAVSER